MVCIDICFISSILLGNMILSMFVTSKDKIFLDFQNKLDSSQKKIYKKIVHERLKIYLIGYILGLICGSLYIYNSNSKKSKKLCIFITITIIIKLSYYKISPKSTYMVEHLKNKEQNKAWINIYKHMSRKWIFGTIIGLLGYFLFLKL